MADASRPVTMSTRQREPATASKPPATRADAIDAMPSGPTSDGVRSEAELPVLHVGPLGTAGSSAGSTTEAAARCRRPRITPARLLDRPEPPIPKFAGRCRPVRWALVRRCRAGCPDGPRPLPTLRTRHRSDSWALACDRSQEAARSAALVNTMSTPLRPAPTNGHLRAPTRSTAPGAVSRTNANRDQPTPTLTVPHNPRVAGSNPAPATIEKNQLRGPSASAAGPLRCSRSGASYNISTTDCTSGRNPKVTSVHTCGEVCVPPGLAPSVRPEQTRPRRPCTRSQRHLGCR